MTAEMKKWYDKAMSDDQFESELVAVFNKRQKPRWHSDIIMKGGYVAYYCGWLVGKGKYEQVKNEIEWK